MSTGYTSHSIVSKRYAKALLELANEQKAADKIENDFNDLLAMIEQSEDLRILLKSASIKQKEREQSIAEICKKAKFNNLTTNFLHVLVKNNRLNITKNIIHAFIELLNQSRGRVSAFVKTAQPLNDKQVAEIEARLSEILNVNISIKNEVDERIIGGTIITYESFMIDDSVKRKLERLRNTMTGAANQNKEKQTKKAS